MRGGRANKPPSTRARKRAGAPPLRRPGTPQSHHNGLMRAYVKRKVVAAMPEYFEVQEQIKVVRGQNNVLKGAIVDILYEAAIGDKGDVESAYARARDLVGVKEDATPTVLAIHRAAAA